MISQQKSLIASIEATPIATVVTNPREPDNPIVGANAAFCALTGYSAEEVVGRNCRFLGGPQTDGGQRSALRRAVVESRPTLVELTNYRKDGTAFRNAVMIAPLLDDAGEVEWFVGSQMDVSGRTAPLPLPRPDAQALTAGLTPRHMQVLELMVAGYRNKQIAASLGISEKTVKMHRKEMLIRLGAPTSADAIRIGVEAGLAG